MAVKNSLVSKKETFSTFLTNDAVRNKINQTLGGKDGQRFMSAILSAVSVNPTLQECDHSTIISAALLGEGLKLSPSPQLGQYYLVPFNDNKLGRKVATFVLGYKGYIQLAIRSGYYKKINVLAIKEGELVKFNPLTEEIEVNLIDDDEVRENAPTIGYYAMFEYMSGFTKAMYWSRKKMEIHADKYSKAFSFDAYRRLQEGKIADSEMWKYSSFWYKDFDGMAYKTMLRQLISKWGIMSIDMQTAFANDKEVADDTLDKNYVENAASDESEQPIKEPSKDEPIAPEIEDIEQSFFDTGEIK